MPRDSMNVDQPRISGLAVSVHRRCLLSGVCPLAIETKSIRARQTGLCEQWCCFTAKTDRLAETAQCDGLVVSADAAVFRKNYQRGFLGLGASGVLREKFGQ